MTLQPVLLLLLGQLILKHVSSTTYAYFYWSNDGSFGSPTTGSIIQELGLGKLCQLLPQLRQLVKMLLMLLGINFGFELLLSLPCTTFATFSASVGYTFITYTESPKTLASYGLYASG